MHVGSVVNPRYHKPKNIESVGNPRDHLYHNKVKIIKKSGIMHI
jgi:hypothetical protein